MSFAQPFFLLLLTIPLALAWLEFRHARAKRVALRFSDLSVTSDIPGTFWSRFYSLPTILCLAAISLLIVALARPQERNVSVERSSEGIDIMLVVDLSTSMLARDFSPNRLEAARDVAINFVSGRVSDRIGLVVFARRAYTQTPLTLDYDFVRHSLRQMELGVLEDGTAIGTALATAVARLRSSDAESKVVILLTDGHNNRGEIDPLTAAELARLHNIRVYAIGMGSAGLDAMGRPLPSHIRRMLPEDGGVDEATLQTVADRTGGAYFHASDRAALAAIYDEISEMEKTEISEETFVHVADRYQMFLRYGLGLLFISILLATTRLRRVP